MSHLKIIVTADRDRRL